MVAAPIVSAAQRASKTGTVLKNLGKDFHIDPRESDGTLSKGKSSKPFKKYKGSYIGKERYKGLTRNAPKGKYKGKYIGPDRFKGDVAAYTKWKEEKRAKKNKKGAIGTQPVGTPATSPNNPAISATMSKLMGTSK